MEQVAANAVNGFAAWRASSAGVDERLADQLVLPMLFVDDRSVWSADRVSMRLKTMEWLVSQFLPGRMVVEGEIGEPGRIIVVGRPFDR